jgi:hypothetical protein
MLGLMLRVKLLRICLDCLLPGTKQKSRILKAKRLILASEKNKRLGRIAGTSKNTREGEGARNWRIINPCNGN